MRTAAETSLNLAPAAKLSSSGRNATGAGGFGLAMALAFLLVLGAPCVCHGSEAAAISLAGERSEAFLREIAPLSVAQIEAVSLTWRVEMQARLNIRLQMTATLRMQRTGDGYLGSFRLGVPEGKDAWSWLLLNLFGKHTQEYRELIQRIEVRLNERFFLDKGLFLTESLEDFLPEQKDYAEQTAIRLQFPRKSGSIRFWPDKARPADFQSMPWTGQTGPMTAFFNYLFFLPPETNLHIVNALKQVVDAPDGSGDKSVSYFFTTENARLGRNQTGDHPDLAMAIFLRQGNFLDIIYGDHIFFQLDQFDGSVVKIPRVFRIEGIISKNRKMKRLRKLQEGDPTRRISHEELFADLDEILAARDVRGYLIDYALSTVILKESGVEASSGAQEAR